MRKHDWRLAPLAVVTWAGCWLGTSGWRPEPGVLIGGAGLLVVCALLVRRVWVGRGSMRDCGANRKTQCVCGMEGPGACVYASALRPLCV